MFSKLPNKVQIGKNIAQFDVWPQYGESCEMNLFYREYVSAEGWIGESFIGIWQPKEVREFEPYILETYPSKYHFFATDGGGSKFGFTDDNGKIEYVSAPDIGSEDDIRILGAWPEFLGCLRSGDYI